ncbi:MAG: NAD-dependent epimerase/dehydratase family protein [Gammaproteobacteria bacterium]|nr:NAD-dependent epimerase/dehydratase family protein [Gammaproteobacteria bacterium]
MDRRSFLHSAALSAIALSAPVVARSAKTTASQKILVLGGTNFLGPAIVEAALSGGHEVTLFNRGVTRPQLFPGTEKLRGDRRNGVHGLSALGRGRTWDAVIDVWPADTSMVEASAKLLAERAEYYFFVSSIAVYRSFARPWVDESAELRLRESGYGGEKARAERIVSTLYPERHGVARCPSIFGPRDPGSSLHYWLRNFYRNDEVLAPGAGDDPVQFVDVRDVARWIVDSAVQKRAGIYNTAAPPIRFADFLNMSRIATESDAKLVWVPKDFLYSQDVEAFTQLPMWIPVNEDPGFFQISAKLAHDEGFETRPPQRTLTAAWRWYQSAFFDDTIFPHNGWGMSNEMQVQLLSSWHDTQKRGD